MSSFIALIPARCGSTRVKDKNIYPLLGHPLLAYSISSAINSAIFEEVFVCTDSPLYRDISLYYGASVPSLRPSSISGKYSSDCEWVSWMFDNNPSLKHIDYACILRPTSPFRRSSTIVRAISQFQSSKCDTLRAVRPVSEHPAKMWVQQGDHIVPLLPLVNSANIPLHSTQTSTLFDCYVQDASLEIFSISNFLKSGQITGSSIHPFVSQNYEGFDINTPSDIDAMNNLISASIVQVQSIDQSPFIL